MSSEYRRAALFVDFDNIYSSLRETDPAAARVFAHDPLRWSNWLEQQLGAVGPDADETIARVLLYRTCYLNPSTHGAVRPYFTRAGFRVVDCPSLTQQGKNSADIHMVIDALDLLAHPTRYDEFLVLSLDADFTPLFQRLRSFDRRVVMLGSGPSSAALRNTCDYVIPDDVFITEALLQEDVPPVGGGLPPVVSVPSATADQIVGSEAPTAPAARPSGDAPVADGERLRQDLADALREMVADSPVPVKMATAATRLADRFGPEVTAGRWAGTGAFKAFVLSIADGRLQCRIQGVIGFLFEPGRHDIEAAMTEATSALARPSLPQDTSRFVGPWADAAARVCRVLGFPALLPSEWAGIFSGMARELSARPFTSLAALERTVAGGSDDGRASVRFVGVGLSQAGYDLAAGEHASRRIGDCFHGHMLRLADNAQLQLDGADRTALRDWLLGGLPPDPRSVAG